MSDWHFKPAPRRPGTQLTWFQSWMFLKSRERRNTVAVAARRSGKTVGVRARIIDACLDSAPGDVGYMAPTLGQAKRLLWRPLMRDLRDPAARHFVEGRPNGSELTIEFKTGVRLYLYSAEAYERVRGDGFKLFVTDESDDPLFTDEVFDEAIYPSLSDNLGHHLDVGTPKGRGRLFRQYRKGQPGEHFDPDYATIQVPAWDAGIIAREEIERARRTRPKRAFEQEYGATFNAPIGLVYDEWNEDRHVVGPDKLPHLHEFDEVIVGVDFGTAARGAMLPIGLDRVRVPAVDDIEEGEVSRAWIVEEHSESGLAYADRSGDRKGWWGIARDIQRSWHPTTWYYDPAGGSGDATEARAAGLGRQLAEVVHSVDPRARVLPADNRVGPGIAAVQQHLHFDDMLGEPPRLHVLSSCKWTIKEFGSYRWAGVRGSEEDLEDRPVKSMDHAMDAVRYGIHTHLYSPRISTRRRETSWEDRPA